MATERGARRAKESKIVETFSDFEARITEVWPTDRTRLREMTLRLALGMTAIEIASRRSLLGTTNARPRPTLEERLEQNDRLFSLLRGDDNEASSRSPTSTTPSSAVDLLEEIDLRASGDIESLVSLVGVARTTLDTAVAHTSDEIVRLLDELGTTGDRDVELLGLMYEANLGETRGSSGSHFTPPRLIDELLSHAGLTSDPDSPRSVCDPSMGTGALLIEVCRRLSSDTRSRCEIARTVLYGVDRDKRAVALARLSTWLFCSPTRPAPIEVMQSLRFGDSLTGLSSLAPIDAMLPGWRSMHLSNETIRAIADEISASDGCRDTHENRRKITAMRAKIEALSQGQYVARESATSSDRFHWPIEFRDVFSGEHPGFDRIVANPPFLGGQKISTRLGSDYRRRLVERLAEGRGGNIDLSAFFLLRATELLSPTGKLAFIATSTIAQGDTREAGLERLITRGVSIYRAATKIPWPGKASLEIVLLWGTLGTPRSDVILNGRKVSAITARLDEGEGETGGAPHRLANNRGIAFVGSYVLGRGFVLDHDEVERLIDEDARSAEVIVPYLDGRDITEAVPLAPSRWVIQLDERTEEEARAYGAIWRHLERHVKPERLTKDASKYPRMVETWWRHWNNRRALYASTRSLDRMLVRARVSSTHAFAFVPTQLVASEQVVVFALDDETRFGVLQSAVHELWVASHASTLGAGLRYTPSDCLETFPFPQVDPRIEPVALALRIARDEIAKERSIGLTAIYRGIHAQDAAFTKLRELTAALDRAVVDAYGWADLDLDHRHRETPRGHRFSVSPSAASELLKRLRRLNLDQARAKARLDGGLRA